MTDREGNGHFAKGNQAAKGNKGGRPRRSTEERLLARLTSLISNDEFDKMIAVAVSRSEAGDVGMLKLLLGYLIGLPIQRTELTGADGGPVEIDHHVDADELAEALAVLGRTGSCRCG